MKRAAPKSMKFHVYVRFVAVFLPVLLVILAQNVYTTSLIQSHAVELTANTLSLFDSQMSLSLTYMDRSLLNTNIDSLYHSSVKNSRLFPGPFSTAIPSSTAFSFPPPIPTASSPRPSSTTI